MHNVNCRFCSAIHSVNEKKKRADKYDFLCETWRWDSKNFVKPLLHKIFVQKPVGMFGEQEYHICLHVFPLYKTFIIDL